jgi:uncharacterized protein (TIGR02246 family)
VFKNMIPCMLRIRPLLWPRITMIAITICLSMAPAAKAGASGAGDRKNPDNRQLLSNAESLVSAWNQNDAEMIVELFLPDAVLITPTGKIARSRSAIRQRLILEWNGHLKGTKLSHAVKSVSLLGTDTAVVQGRYRLNGVKILGFEKSPEGSFIFHHKKQEGRWMISQAELFRDKAE